MVKDGNTTSYTYNSNNQLLTETTGGITVTYSYDGNQIIADYNGSTLLRKYVYGPGIDEPVCMITVSGQGETKYYYFRDALGSVVALLNNGGSIVEAYSYDSFGRPKVHTAANAWCPPCYIHNGWYCEWSCGWDEICCSGSCHNKCQASSATQSISISGSSVQPAVDGLSNALDAIPKIDSTITLSGNFGGTQGEECCNDCSTPTTYKTINGTVALTATISVELSPCNFQFEYTWQNVGEIDTEVGLTVEPSVTASASITASGKVEGSCGVCRQASVSLSVCIGLTVGGVATIDLKIHPNWLWDGTVLRAEASITGSATASIGSGGTWKSSECTSPTGYTAGCTNLGATTINGQITFSVGGLGYEANSGNIVVFEGYNTCGG